MISQREVERKYKKLINDVKTKEYYTSVNLENRVNCYRCKCGHITKTKDIDAGVTPFMLECERCGEDATSTFFKDIAPDLKPTQHWYRPSLEELLKTRKNEALLEHVFMGGLLNRKLENGGKKLAESTCCCDTMCICNVHDKYISEQS